MVLKTATCRFSGLRIYPGKGIIYVRVDGNQFLFMNQKCKSLFQQRKRPAKIAWTVTYRKQHKKVRGDWQPAGKLAALGEACSLHSLLDALQSAWQCHAAPSRACSLRGGRQGACVHPC